MAKFLDKAGLEHFWASLKTLFNSKVDKVTGKGLSTNDFTTDLNNKLTTSYNRSHTHSNKSVLDGITATKVANWDNASPATYGGISADANIGETFTIGTKKYAKIILADVNDTDILTLQLRQNSSVGPIIYTFSTSQIVPGVEIEILNGYIFVKNASGVVLATVQKPSTTTKLYFYLSAGSSSDVASFVYRIEG